jgi:hypothetical protein
LFNIFGRSMAGRVGEILRGLAADIDAVETHAAEEASAQLGGMPFDASIAEMVIDGLADAAAWQLALAFDAAPDPHLVFGAEREARRAAARPGAPAGLQRAADLLRVAPGDSFTACLARARGAAPAARDVFGPCPPEVVAFAMYYVAAARECPGDLVEMLAESGGVGRAVPRSVTRNRPPPHSCATSRCASPITSNAMVAMVAMISMGACLRKICGSPTLRHPQ